MQAPACGASFGLPSLSTAPAFAGFKTFLVQVIASTVMGVPIAILNVGRNTSGCPGYLAARAGTNGGVATDNAASDAMQQWLLEPAAKDAAGQQLVYVVNQVGLQCQ
jgi:hypothetical protein